MRLTLRQLQIYLAVAQTGSTSAAAEVLALSQSATSAALNELESVLAVQLFDRVGKRLMLNDSGRTLLPQARQMLDAAASIEGQFSGAGSVELRIGSSTTIGIYLLPAMLAATPDSFAHPRVMIANSADVAAAVERYEVDFGLIEGPCHAPGMVVEAWLRDELIIVAAPGHAFARGMVSVEALAQAGWLLREPGSGTREAVEQALLPHLHYLRAAGEFSNSEAIKHAAAEGLGLACLSRWVVGDLLAMGRLVEVQTAIPPLRRQFYLIYSERKILSPRLTAFLQFCRGYLS